MAVFEQRGGEILANTATPGHQDGAEIAYLADGKFVLVWRDQSASGGDLSGRAIRGQMFNADGSKSGGEFLINTQTAGDQNEPGVVALAGGGFAVVWTDTNQAGDGSLSSVKGQVFAATGAKLGGEFLVNTTTQGTQRTASLASLKDGGFVVTFEGFLGGISTDIGAQIFNADGSKRGGELVVNEATLGVQTAPVVATLSDGRFVIAWQDDRDDAREADIRAQIYNVDGSKSGAEFLVNIDSPQFDPLYEYFLNDQIRPHIAALDGGGFVISWQDSAERREAGGDGIRAQIYGADGAPVGSEIRVPQQTAGSQTGTFVAGLADGGFAVVWTGGGDGNGLAVKAALFDASGGRNGDEFLVNDIVANDQHATFVVRSDDGFTVAWADLSGQSGDASGSGIKFTRFLVSPATDGDDVLSGTEAADGIHGLGGNDTLSGLGGDDELIGGEGADRLEGGLGADRLRGDGGADLLNGGAGRDDLAGGTGDDELNGEADEDVLTGGDGADRLSGGLGNDTLAGDAGDDALDGGEGNDALEGGAGADVLEGGTGDDTLRVTADAAPALDVAHGGAGTDTLTIDLRALMAAARSEAAPAGDLATGLSGAILSDAGHRIEFSGVEQLTLLGGAGADRFVGSIGSDTLNGGAGDDRLEGGQGNDMLDGEGGNDTLIGGMGDDVLGVDSTGDVVVEAGGEGTDTVRASIAYALGANLENLVGVGATGLALTGNGGSNRITGTDGNDVIDGGAGADRMLGGSGNDVYIVDDLGDFVEESDPWMSTSPGVDEIRTALPVYKMADLVGLGRVYSYVENLTGLSSAGQSLTGNDLGNVITGNLGNDILDGLRGADKLIGGQGDDVYFVDDAADQVIELAGQGTDEVRVNLTNYTLGANVENGTILSSGPATLTGNGLNNVLRGGAGWDTLDGGAGADTLIGGAGNDWYKVDLSDTILEVNDASGGFDSVEVPFATYTLPDGVELAKGTSAQQTLRGNDGDNWLDGMGGSDTLIGGKGNDFYYDYGGETIVEAESEGVDMVRTTLSYYKLGANLEELQAISFSIGQTLIGNELNNRIIGTLLNNRSDTIDGGLGADLMIGYHGSDIYYVDNAGDVIVEEAHHGTADEVRTTLAAYTLATNVERLIGLNSTGQALTGNGLANRIEGGAGDDLIAGGGGTDTLVGGVGNDVYVVDSLDDVVTEAAGEGVDEVRTSIANYVLPANVEKLTFVGAGNGTLRGNAGDNMLAGGGGNDTLYLGEGGEDQASGGAGNDVFFYGAALGAGDKNDGGEGNDTLVLQGNVDVTLGAGALTGIEGISIQSGSVTRWGQSGTASYDFALRTVDANVAAGQQLRVNGQSLKAGEDFRFDGSGESDGSFLIYGGFGADVLTGGARNDIFFFEAGRFGDGDRIEGGAGNDALVLSGARNDGTNVLQTFIAGGVLSSIESISFNGRFATVPDATPSYEVNLQAGNVAPGARMIVNASSLGAGQSLKFDASSETSGFFFMIGGAGNDQLSGGQQGDLLYGGGGRDILRGGGGADLFDYRSIADSAVGASDRVFDFTFGQDRIGLADIDADTGRDGDQTFTFIGQEAFSAAGQLRAIYRGSTEWLIQGDVNGDGLADFEIIVTASGPGQFGAADFLL